MLGFPIFLFLVFIDAIGDCEPYTDCKKGFLTQVLLPSVAITFGVFLLTRWAIRAARDSST
ncbi:hypothetical protein BV97_01536 [Novosphingobium resinovorum]|jgi:hypothetical protein|uniref:Uncharacterized protein n=1 Tax=Novosphingobium resinovorum TaxID=158500 RepID=A0A031K2G9_9SPHN|nr:hypothetical protein BV97_01536 [Novosphingobium resinovorum]